MSIASRLRALRPRPAPAAAARAVTVQAWLELFADELGRLDASCAGGGGMDTFRTLDADLWALLLTREFDGWPHIRALLPDVPEPGLQAAWNGVSGAPLAAQGAAFYRRLRDRYAEHGAVPLETARTLDFGCGWGRLTRMLARDVAPGRLFGCDPSEAILDVCRADRVPAVLARSDPLPDRIPFDGGFDLAFAFSVFTHLSEVAHAHCLDALHAALVPGGILVVTVRPPAYLPDARAPYAFVPHPGETTYGETVVTLDYVRDVWSDRFVLVAVDVLLDDPFQIMLTLRRSWAPPP